MHVCQPKSFYKKTLSAALAGLFLPVMAWAAAPFTVKDIQVTGLQSTEPGMIFSYLPIRVGSQFTDDTATQLVKKLYATDLFEDVKVATQGNIVHITVVERPVISSILYEGMHAFDSKTLSGSLADVGFGVGRALNPALLDRAEDEIRSQYIAKGKYAVQIDHTLTPLPGNRVGVSFAIQEGSTSNIEEIHIVGSHDFSESDLLDELNLTTPGFMTWFTGTDKFSREKLDQDTDNLRNFYLDHGYLDVKIDQPQVTITPDRHDISIGYALTEGKPYTIRKQQLAGDLMGMGDEFESYITQATGQVYNNGLEQAAAQRMKTRLGELGYANAQVNVIPTTDPSNQQVDVTFMVEPGTRVYVRRINIGGNTRTRDQVIRRELRQQEGAWYDGARLSTSRDRVDRLGYFNDVQVTQQGVPGVPDQVDINVDVKEKPTGMINLGVGYGSTDKLSFQAGISQDNIFGSGTDLSFQVNTSKYNRAGVLTHTDPYFTQSGISRTTSLYYREYRPYSDYTDEDYTYKTKSYGLGMSFGVPISENDRIFMGATLERNTVELPGLDSGYNLPEAYYDFVDEYGKSSNVLLLNVGWAKDTRDSGLAPTRGHRTSLNATIGVGDLQYWMASAQHQHYFPLGKDYTLAFNVEADYGRTFDSSKPFPVIKNLYAGGIGSVRGYEGSSLGPRDRWSGDYLGGSSRLLANVQLYLPFPGTQNDRTLRWFVFGDAGKLGVTGSTECSTGNAEYGGIVDDPCGWRYSAGIGLSWQSPLGPLEISWAHPINAKEGDDKQQFQFQIGTSF